MSPETGDGFETRPYNSTPIVVEPACVIIPAGEFRMGCETGRDEEQPVHTVWTDAFELAVLQVTVCDYGRFLTANGAQPPRYWGDAGFSHPDQPAYCRKSGGIDQRDW